MERFPRGWLTAIVLTVVGTAVGASVAFVDGTALGSDPTGTQLVLLGGLLTVLAARAASSQSPLADA